MYKLGWKQFVPFIVTVVGIVGTDLLKGIGMGLAVGLFVVLYKKFSKLSFFYILKTRAKEVKNLKMTLAEEVTFLNKGAILKRTRCASRIFSFGIGCKKNKISG